MFPLRPYLHVAHREGRSHLWWVLWSVNSLQSFHSLDNYIESAEVGFEPFNELFAQSRRVEVVVVIDCPFYLLADDRWLRECHVACLIPNGTLPWWFGVWGFLILYRVFGRRFSQITTVGDPNVDLLYI